MTEPKANNPKTNEQQGKPRQATRKIRSSGVPRAPGADGKAGPRTRNHPTKKDRP
jgi:hypothetical protein